MSLENSTPVTTVTPAPASIGFTQVPNCIIEHSTISVAAKMVYITLLKFSWQTDRAWPSQETLATELGASVRSVRKWLSELEQHSLITIQRRGKNIPNLYVVNESVSKRDRQDLPMRPADISSPRDRQDLPPKNTQEQYSMNKTHDPIVASLKAEGITDSVAAKLVLKHGPGPCQTQLDWLPYRKFRDKAAFLVKAIQERYPAPSALEKSQPQLTRSNSTGLPELAGRLSTQGLPGADFLLDQISG